MKYSSKISFELHKPNFNGVLTRTLTLNSLFIGGSYEDIKLESILDASMNYLYVLTHVTCS